MKYDEGSRYLGTYSIKDKHSVKFLSLILRLSAFGFRPVVFAFGFFFSELSSPGLGRQQ